MDKDSILLFGLTACALGLSIFILWGPKLSRRGNGNCSLMGLQNLGLTCFLNSLLQALAACPSFLEWLRTREDNGSVSYSLYNTLRLLCYERHPESPISVISPGELIYSLRGKSWPSFPQEQDPHELFLHLISSVEEEEQKAKPQRANSLLDALESDCDLADNIPKENSQGDVSSNKKSPMKLEGNLLTASPFRGYLASQLSCLRCGQKSAVVYDKFDTLSLPLPSKSAASFRLSRLLSDFVSAELVDGFSCDSCSPSQGPTQASKAIKIGKLPKCLCLHISRTMMDNNGFMYKRENYVEVPELLQMSEYTHTSHMVKERNKLKGGGLADGESNGIINNMKVSSSSFDLLSATLNNNNPIHFMKGAVYKLRAVIEHRGTVDSGHFVTYRRAPLAPNEHQSHFSESRWYFTSDDIVKKTNLNEVISSSAYLLFYEKCPELSLVESSATL